jgi:hypothetical protein
MPTWCTALATSLSEVTSRVIARTSPMVASSAEPAELAPRVLVRFDELANGT